MGNNYQKELEKIISKLEYKPRLLLHSCCAPCSSYCLLYLIQYFDVTVFYYNPNITSSSEYLMRVNEQKRLIDAFNMENFSNNKENGIKFVEGSYNPEVYLERVKGYEDCKEGGDRCRICFDLRLGEAAKYAKANSFDYFTTTLTISPLKNADVLNEIGQKKGLEEGIDFLPSDFKKKEGYKRSIELSKEYELYRQNYCGCPFSKRDVKDSEDR